VFPRLKGFVVKNTSFRQLLGDVFIEWIPSIKDKSIELMLRKKLNLETFVVEDQSIERTYLENVYIDILRLCDSNILKKLWVRSGTNINFSKYSTTLSFFFDEIGKFVNLEYLKIQEFDLEEANLIEFYVDTIKRFKKLKTLDLSWNSINNVWMKSILFEDEIEQEIDFSESSKSTFPWLETLVINRNSLTDMSVKYIEKHRKQISPWLKNLILHPQNNEESAYQELLKKAMKHKSQVQ
jgi:Leucine-rich repeat (LRR) protein